MRLFLGIQGRVWYHLCSKAESCWQGKENGCRADIENGMSIGHLGGASRKGTECTVAQEASRAKARAAAAYHLELVSA